jgi:hypothetical protein
MTDRGQTPIEFAPPFRKLYRSRRPRAAHRHTVMRTQRFTWRRGTGALLLSASLVACVSSRPDPLGVNDWGQGSHHFSCRKTAQT